MKTHALLNSLIFLLIVLYIYTATSKLFEWKSFKDELARMPIIGNFPVLIAAIIPSIELLLATALAFSTDLKYPLWGSFTLLLIFTIYIIGLLNFAPHLPCSCGGIIQQLNWHQHLALNCLFIALNLAAIKLAKRINQI